MEQSISNYSEHRPDNLDWMNLYRLQMGKTDFDEFLNRVFARLMKMRVDEIYDLTKKVGADNRALFIKIACYFIQCGNNDYYFSDDYTLITKGNP